MGLDSLSPVAPARVRCLLLPFGKITSSRFVEFVERLQGDASVRLGDIGSNDGSERHMFSPLAFPTGWIVYDMKTSAPPSAHRSLIPFELYRETLVVIGIADGKKYIEGSGLELESQENPDADQSELSGCIPYLKDNYPTALVHRLLVFDSMYTSSTMPSGHVIIPPRQCSNAIALKTVMTDLTTIFLEELTSFAKSVQALPNIETPKIPLASRSDNDPGGRGSRPNSRAFPARGSQTASAANDIDRDSHRSSLPAHLSLSTAPDFAANGSRYRDPSEMTTKPSITLDDMSNLPDRPASTSSTEKPKQANKEKVAVHGFGSGSFGERARNQAQSRIGIVTGSMFLLAGRWPDARRLLADGATAAKASSDYAWHAKALDYLLVTLLMYAWAGLDFDIPQICYPFGDKSSQVGSKSAKHPADSGPDSDQSNPTSETTRLLSLQNLCNLIPDLANNIIHLYSRAAQFNSDQVPQIVYSETTIRLARLLSFVQASFGVLDIDGLGAIVLSHAFKRDRRPPERRVTFLNRADIAHFVYRAIPVHLPETPVETTDRLNILAGIASILAFLGYHRKKAFFLREFIAMLLPALVQSRKDSAAELGVHPAASLSALDLSRGENEIGLIGHQYDSEFGLQNLLASVCDVYGVVLSVVSGPKQLGSDPLSSNGGKNYEDTNTISKRALLNASKRSFGNPLLKMDILRSCINICEALPDLGGILRFSSDLMRTAGSGIAPGPDTVDGFPSIPIEDQVRLTNNISRTVSAGSQLGFDQIEAEYWDEFLVRDIDVLENGPFKVPLSRRKADLDLASAGIIAEKNGPFIFNPFSAKVEPKSQENLLVTNEESIFVLLLQNLYDVDLEIEWIKFDVTETEIDALLRGVVIGPYRTQKVHIPSIPRSTGRLKLHGCIAKIKGCRARRFPLFRSPWKMQEDVKMKQIGFSASALPTESPSPLPSERARSVQPTIIKTPRPSIFEANVIEAQPTLVVRSTSLHQSAIMIPEGERRNFTITVANVSAVPTDLLLISFRDSTSELLETALGKDDLSATELYEAEFGVYRNPALHMAPCFGNKDLLVPPRGELTFEVEILGKLGLTHGSAHIEYGFLGIPRSEVKDRFFTRQLDLEFFVTVSPCIELVYNNFVPFKGFLAPSDLKFGSPANDNAIEKRDVAVPDMEDGLETLFRHFGLGSQERDHCLMILELHNAWPSPVFVSLQVYEDESNGSQLSGSTRSPYTAKKMIQSHESSRILLPVPRLSLRNPHAPIPCLNPKNKRQFVISASKISPDLECLRRETFWYREELLKRLRATWSVPGSNRQGNVDLRRLSIEPRMLEAIKVDELDVSVTISNPTHSLTATTATSSSSPEIQASVQELSRSSFSVPTCAFVDLTTTLTSRLTHPIYPLLRLQPALRAQPYNVALDLGRKLAFNGVLQRALPLLAPGESRAVTIGVVFLAAGEYELGACVEEVRPWRPLPPARDAGEKFPPRDTKDAGVAAVRQARSRAETGDFGLLGPERVRRRAWYARDACLVDAKSEEAVDQAGEIESSLQ